MGPNNTNFRKCNNNANVGQHVIAELQRQRRVLPLDQSFSAVYGNVVYHLGWPYLITEREKNKDGSLNNKNNTSTSLRQHQLMLGA